MAETIIMCPVCWNGSSLNPAASSTICDLCQQMIGRSALRSFSEVKQHYHKLMGIPDLPAKMKEYIEFRTIDAIKNASPDSD